jgi:hypothetical protein
MSDEAMTGRNGKQATPLSPGLYWTARGWFSLPLKIRQLWWRETNYNRKPPSPEFMARLPQALADALREVEDDKREKAADTAKAREFLRQAQQPPCKQCLRPASPCKDRCLRSMLVK